MSDSPEWFLWYGARMGLPWDVLLALPLGELCDLIACEQIKNEGWESVPPPRYEPLSEEEEAEAFFKLLERE